MRMPVSQANHACFLMPAASTVPDSSQQWTLVIGPHQGCLDWRLRELWSCRDLISLLVWRDFVALYKQTILGPAWHVIQPLLTTLTFSIVFGNIARLPTDGHPVFLFYLSGNVLWNFFASCLTKTANTFVGNAGLLGKVYFHRLAIPIATVLSTLISFGIQFAVFLVAWLLYLWAGANVSPNWWILASPLAVLAAAGFALSAGIAVSALTTRYRDLSMLVTFGVQLLMFATPVIYPMSMVPEKYRWIVWLNPMSPVVEAFRAGFLGGGSVSLGSLAFSFGCMIAMSVASLMLFFRVERSFMDTV